ncbi:MAG: metal ABC transporter ATP-binding protein [Phycisphaerales bacterium]
MNAPDPPHAAARPAAAAFRGVSYTYPSGVRALSRVTLSIEQGELLAVIGPNGGGKSTLIRILIGVLSGYEGTVEVFGRSPAQARREGLIGYVPQRVASGARFPLSSRQVVRMGAARGTPWHRPLPRSAKQAADDAMELVGVSDLADRPIAQLSGGQRQRVMLARAIASGARLLALDEPLAGIDAAGQEQFGQVIARVHDAGDITIVLVSHDLRSIAGAHGKAAADRVACLRQSLHFHDQPAGITPAVLAEVFQHDLSHVFGPVRVSAERITGAATHDDHHHHHHHHHHHEHDHAGPCAHAGDDGHKAPTPDTPHGGHTP